MRVPLRLCRLHIMMAAAAVVLAACSPEVTAETPGPSTLPPATSSTSATTAPTPTTTTTTTTAPTTESTEPPPIIEIVVSPGDDIAQLVEQSDPGTHFSLLPGIHRSRQIRPKDGMVFAGEPGAVLNGAIPVDDLSADGDHWSTTSIAIDQDGHGSCQDDYEACVYRNDLFMDDAMLWRVADRSDLSAGTWWSDGTTIVVFDDPTVRNVEIGISEYAFVSDADNVTIRDLTVEKYAVRAQEGAIQSQLPGGGDFGSNWLIEDVEVRLNHGAGIRTGMATTIRRVSVHHNGQLGLAGSRGEDILVEQSDIANNNIRGFSSGWEAGGTKFTRTVGLTIRETTVHNNLGPGLWTDIDAYATTYLNNTVYDNTGPGIFHEISYDALISGNTVTNNGFAHSTWLWGGGILVAASADVEVSDNVVSGNADGITAIQQDRGKDRDSGGPYSLSNLWVHHNTITMNTGQTGLVEDIDDRSVFTDRNNRFEDNTYLKASGKAFAWNKQDMTWSQWVAAGQDVNGTRE
ncbi:MAG: right-handed parallel beta-helix repeat-containing protein [bacterium]|nr:right-handed parallel beta-helix repeat-containing protein [bacterium]